MFNGYCYNLIANNVILGNASISNQNKTIYHNALINNDINKNLIGMPVFLNENNKIYYLQKIKNNKQQNIKYYNQYKYIELTRDNYIDNSINQVPMVQLENNNNFIGVITNIYKSGDVYNINDTLNTKIIINNDTVDFATHGDYIFKIRNNIPHIFTDENKEPRLYKIGDKILYDGTIIDDNTPITNNILKNTVGIITYIPIDNINYVSVFKN